MNARAEFLGNHLALRLVLSVVALLGLGCVLGMAIAKTGVPLAMAAIVGPPGIYFVIRCFRQPKVGLITSFYFGFFLGGIYRWSPVSVQFGLVADILLTIALLGVLFSASKADMARLHNPMVYAVLLWLGYNILQLANPESRSIEAWFFTIRSFSFYWLQVLIVGLITITQLSDFNRIIRIWSGCSFVLAIWAFEQQYVGLLGSDKEWMDTAGYITHMLQGQLRCFSFCTDAGQFGAVMAQVSLFTGIRAINEPKWSKKVGLGILALIYFWAFALSGSRGPVLILGLGAMVYLCIKKNVPVLILGGILLVGVYGLLKFTTAGQSNYQVQRMRSSLDPNDPSLQVRLNNQKTFKAIMQNKPFGVGLGMTANGSKFGASGVLTELGIDSWYVRIWLETGMIGLTVHLFPLLLLIVLACIRIGKLKNKSVRTTMEALLCSYIGIVGASYGNQLLGQFPTNLVMYVIMVLLLNAPLIDADATAVKSLRSP